jgi:hypothetical protein
MDKTTIGHVGKHMRREDTSFRDFGTQISGVADLIIFAAFKDIFSSQFLSP